jgi:putative transposase
LQSIRHASISLLAPSIDKNWWRKLPRPIDIRSWTLPGIPGGVMKKSGFADSQIVAVLKEGDAGVPVAQLVRMHGISTATYYTWRSKYAGIGVSDLKRMRELEAENAKLKRMYADLALENVAIKDVLSRKL